MKISEWLVQAEKHTSGDMVYSILADWIDERTVFHREIAGLKAEVEQLQEKLSKINDIAVGFHETGPHDPQTALEFMDKIYDLSLLEEVD